MEKVQAFESLESYQQIFAKCEESLKQIQSEKETAVKERDLALKEVNTVRQRYKNIVGAEAFGDDNLMLSK